MTASQISDLVQYYGLVRYHANKWHRLLLFNGVDIVEMEELRQVGFVGLLEASKNYDPNKGASFSTHATRRIDGAIKDYLRKQDPLTQRERMKVKELDNVRDDFIKSSLREPTTAELAEALGISEDNLRKREALRVFSFSLDAAEETQDHIFWEPPSIELDPEQKVTSKEQSEKIAVDVNDCLENALTDQERRILIFRIRDELILQLVGRLENMSKDTVKRREVKAKSEMRQCLDSKGWQVADIIELLP